MTADVNTTIHEVTRPFLTNRVGRQKSPHADQFGRVWMFPERAARLVCAMLTPAAHAVEAGGFSGRRRCRGGGPFPGVVMNRAAFQPQVTVARRRRAASSSHRIHSGTAVPPALHTTAPEQHSLRAVCFIWYSDGIPCF